MQEFISYWMNRQFYNKNGLYLESLNSTIKESSPTIVILSLSCSLTLKVNVNGIWSVQIIFKQFSFKNNCHSLPSMFAVEISFNDSSHSDNAVRNIM